MTKNSTAHVVIDGAERLANVVDAADRLTTIADAYQALEDLFEVNQPNGGGELRIERNKMAALARVLATRLHQDVAELRRAAGTA